MFEIQQSVVLSRVIPLALILLAGCAAKVKEEDVPVLVNLDGGCPTQVTEVVDSCDRYGDQVPEALRGKSDVVCREKHEHITWVAVADPQKKGALPKLVPDQFSITFKDGPLKPSCDKSRAGVLKCTVRGSAKGDYKYTVATTAACKPLDPRFYVP